MENYKISEETVKKILLYTAKALPDRPGEHGMKASDVKGYFYEFIRVLTNAINTELKNIVNGVTSDINIHDLSAAAHDDIRELIKALGQKDVEIDGEIEDLKEKDTELGNSIGNQINAHNGSTEAHSDIREKITDDIKAHNDSTEAHSDIRELIKTAQERANDAHNLASGKSKIYPMHDYDVFIGSLNTESEKYNVGDMFIFDDKQAPDFMLFEKDVEFDVDKDDVEITGNAFPNDVEFVPGMRIVINGIRFVIQESGYDISKLATDEELQLAKAEFSRETAKVDEKAEKIIEDMKAKESIFAKVESTASEITLEAHKEYNLGLVTALELALPEETVGLEAIVNFRTGATAPTFDSPSELVFSGDDTYEGRFYPITNRLYEINIKDVMGVLAARIGATDYEVIE